MMLIFMMALFFPQCGSHAVTEKEIKENQRR